jgi:hypothetical protein
MARPVATIREDIRSLSVSEKEEILSTLLEELEGPPDEGVEAAWLEEIERRGREIESGAVQCIPAKDVFAKLDTILGK